jgi:hypothetical protein
MPFWGIGSIFKEACEGSLGSSRLTTERRNNTKKLAF